MRISNVLFSILILPALSAVLRFADDGELVAALKQRDPHAMARLYDRYGRLAYSIIMRMVRNDAAAEDLVQETFLRIWNRIQAFDEEKGALGPWVLAVARNRAIDYLRSAEGRKMETALEMETLEQPAVFASVESGLLNADRVRLLKRAFDKLTPNQREVIELAYWEGLSQTEMSERLKQPLGTVKTWVRTALRTLREELGEAVVA
jgi:RNA polymerase sigma-70 factor (ECF subfamily)